MMNDLAHHILCRIRTSYVFNNQVRHMHNISI
jgi:hypothetical protein